MNRKLTNSKVVFQAIKSQLTLENADEIHAIALAVMEKYFGLSLTEILSEKEIDPIDFSKIIKRINQHEPLQYILGEADFFGRKFKVNTSVLIPRPETELLLREILNLKLSSPKILDIGTGSGCIPITLKLEIPNASVTTLDISAQALSLAKTNAQILKTDLVFIQQDFLQDFSLDPVDIIVSNPPYVRESEKETMRKNVLEHEPHVALFVSDNNPIVFYKAIAAKSRYLLKPNGKVFVEINELFGPDVKELFENSGFNSVQIIKDLDGKDRVVSAIKNH